MTVQITTLDNGLRVITDSVFDVDSIALGVWADVGTRHENLEHNGIAHMVEHMMFNGTPSRSSQDIAIEIENVGGQINAYTSREVTAYYVHILKEHSDLALDILADILQNPTFPDHELEKERAVIIQEIGMNNDTPDELVFDQYQEAAYPNQALGAPILGTSAIVSSIKKQDLFDYVRKFYTPSRLVVSAAGNLQHEDFVKKVEGVFVNLPQDYDVQLLEADYRGGDTRDSKDLEQAHLVLGFQGVSRFHENYYAVGVLGTLLGGGMSSRLFQEIREKRGLVYSVYASHCGFNDDGLFEIYAGTDPERLKELIPVLCDEVRKIVQEHVTQEELDRAKAQIKSSLIMSRESMMSRANRQAKYFIHHGKVPDIQSIIDSIDSVNSAQIQEAAQSMFSTHPTVASLGPLAQLEEYDKIESRLAA